MSSEDQQSEIDEQLLQMCLRMDKLIENCRAQSCYNGFVEIADMALREGRVHYYVHGLFYQMTQSTNLLDFHTVKERAIKLISLLQKPEGFFKIQPDVAESLFQETVQDVSSCVYENLASAAGHSGGFNSRGLHDSISGGIQICRTTGKFGCIKCFREYACDVYLAADDFCLARHQCQQVLDHKGEWQGRGNRKWIAMKKMAWMDTLEGDFEGALAKYERALELTDESDVNVPLQAKFEALIPLDAVRIMQGLPQLLPQHEIYSKLPPAEECPDMAMGLDLNQALTLAVSGEWDAADELLHKWDQKLWSRKVLHHWFEVRLRRLALFRLAGRTERFESLAETLEAKATEADDWLTLRRLNEVTGDELPTLLAVRKSNRPKRVDGEAQKLQTSDVDGTLDVQQPFGDEVPMLIEKLDTMLNRMKEAYTAQEPESISHLVDELLEIGPDDSTTNVDTCGVLNLMSMMISPQHADRLDEIWKWANSLAAPFRENGVVLSLLATIGNELRLISEEPEEGKITPARLEQLFRKSLELEKNGPQTYARAGHFFIDRGEWGDGEKCFARAFKLDRGNAGIALKLAEIYNQTERPRDALNILDLCIREGGSDVDLVAWEAAMISFQLRQYQSLLNYLARYEELAGANSPVYYFRAIAFYHEKQYDEALENIEFEREHSEAGNQFHCDVLESCIQMQTGVDNGLEELIDRTVKQRLADLEYMPNSDIAYLHEVLWIAMQLHRFDDPQLSVLEAKMLTAGIIPDDYFDQQRFKTDTSTEVRYYRVLIEQTADLMWGQSNAVLPNQLEWKQFFCEWGVLAPSEDEAIQLALEIQQQCCGGEREVSDVATDDHVYVDYPGVVSQGLRHALPELYDFEQSSGLDNDELDDDASDLDQPGDGFDPDDYGSGGYDDDDDFDPDDLDDLQD